MQGNFCEIFAEYADQGADDMLVHFAVENFLSFKGEATLNMTATADSQHKNHVVHDEKGKKTSVLRAAALYGANAAGKSNLIKAMKFARDMIVLETYPYTETFNISNFSLDPACHKKPGKFEFIIKIEGIQYTYGFAVTRERVVEEWLFAHAGWREVPCFERTTDEKLKTKVKIGSYLATKGSKRIGFLDYVGQGTIFNQLFLNEAIKKNIDELKPLTNWFVDSLTILNVENENASLPSQYRRPDKYSKDILFERIEKDRDLRSFMIQALKNSIPEIHSLKAYTVTRDFPPSMSGSVFRTLSEKKYIYAANDKEIIRGLFTVHKKNREEVRFDLDQESDGTRRFILMLPIIYDAIKEGKTFVIDEIERSLHPLLSRMFLKTFLDEIEGAKGQIIFTTHETTLMDLDLLRRDEIWFAEKDEEEATRIYSLAEFRVRNDLKIDKGYLNGRFGAIPFFGDATKMGFESKT